jgi:predicted transcriptional regulator
MGVLEAILEEVRSTKSEVLELRAKLATIQANDTYMTTEEAAIYTKFDEKTLKEYKEEIGYHQRQRKIIFKKSDLDKWLSRYFKIQK